MSEDETGPPPLAINGWTIYFHPIFLSQVETLARKVEGLKEKDPKGYEKKNATKHLVAIKKLVFEIIPQDPTRSEYRLGDTLGEEYKHWFRAKFFQQYRLFFRYHLSSKLIVYVWVNDENSKRAYQSRTDAYTVFRKMLESGDPPDNFDKLIDKSEPRDPPIFKPPSEFV